MAAPRKHHYLPQFYLKRFSSNGKHLYQIEKEGGNAYGCAITDAAAIRDYHELDYEGVADPQATEKALAAMEGALAETHKSVLTNGVVSREVHADVVALISMLQFRVPAVKRSIEESLRQNVRSSGIVMERAGHMPTPPEGLKDVLQMKNLVITISNWKILQEMFGLAMDLDNLKLLSAMTPSVLRAPQDSFFFTSDQPVALYNPRAHPNDPYGIGLRHPETEITIPLSTDGLLHLSWRNKPPGRLLSPLEIEEYNRRTAVMADSLVFAPHESPSIVRLVNRYRERSAGMELTVLDAGGRMLHLTRVRMIGPD